MIKQQNQLKAGALLSYVNLALSTIIPFLYTPVMLRMLGEEEYGLYSLSHSTIAYLWILTFGFGSTIIRYLSMYRAQGKKKEYEKTFGFFLMLYLGIAVLVMVTGGVIALNTTNIFNQGLTTAEMDKMKILLLIMAFNSAISFPISVFSSVTISYEKFVFRKLVDMLSTVIAPIGNLVALYFGFASVGMAVVSTIIQFLMLPINCFYCIKVIGVKPRFSKMPKPLVKEMLGFSGLVFIGSVVDVIFWSTDKLLLGMYASTTAVAIYNIGCTFNNMITSLSTSISGVLTPKITGIVSTEEKDNELSSIFIKAGRLQFLVIALIISGFAVFGQSFISLWAGETFSDAYLIAIVTMVPLCIPLIQNTGVSIVTAQNKHGFRSIAYLVIAIVNVVATYFAIKAGYGGLGAAVCSGVSYIIGQGIVMNIYYWKVTKIDIPLFWKNILKMSIVPLIMVIIGFLAEKVINFNSWFVFFACVAVYAAIYCISMYFTALNEYEKGLITGIINKIIRRKK